MLENACSKTHFWTEDQFLSQFYQLQTAELWDTPEFQQIALMPFASFCLCFHGLWILSSVAGRGVSYQSEFLQGSTEGLHVERCSPGSSEQWSTVGGFPSFSTLLATVSFSASLKKETESGKITPQKTSLKMWLKTSGEYSSQNWSSYSTACNKLHRNSLESTS